MKTLIVYYSLEGNTEYVVEKIAGKIPADLLSLHPRKAYASKGLSKFLWGGKSAVMGETPELEDYQVDLADYDRLIFGFPVWAGTFTPPIRTFVRDHKEELSGKTISAFACMSGAGGDKALSKLKDALGIGEFDGTAVFVDPKAKETADTDAAIDAFIQTLQ